MIATIILIAVFQGYWLTRLYKDEQQSFKKEADVLFRESVYKLQMQKFKSDTLFQKLMPDNLFMMDAINVIRKSVSTNGEPKPKMVISMSSSYNKIDSTKKDSTKIFFTSSTEQMLPVATQAPERNGEFNRVVFRSSLGDSLSAKQIDSAYKKELEKAKIKVEFLITSKKEVIRKLHLVDSVHHKKELNTNYVTVGLTQPTSYRAEFGSAYNYLLGKITYPILISILLITLTTASFVFLYRNLLAQRRLADLKNDFISNITHELKTPIATVNVAIEALKNFNAIDNPQRTKEYLDISSSELQRLSLLVDKVLKLSLFENKEIELKKEVFDLKQLTEEVISTMQLQLQKKKVKLNFSSEGSAFIIEADKLHITSVIYNLLDNAIKYSPDQPEINMRLTEKRNTIEFSISDNGIGIPAEYKHKIFEKFFRVPHGNTHNIKGYGLGLSYVHHVIEKHNGSIEVESDENRGCTFTVNLLKQL